MSLMKSLKVAGFLAFTSIARGNIGIILLTILILVLVTLNLLFVPGLLGGLVYSANDKLINTYSGDIIVESSSDNPLIRDVDGFVSRIEAIEGVAAATPRNSLGAEISIEDQRTNVVVYGIRPEKEKLAFNINNSIIEGSYLGENDLDKILLGIQVAGAGRPDIELYSRSLKTVHAGDTVTVAYADGVKKKYTVKGIFYTEFIQTDLQALVTERELTTVYPLIKDRAASVRVKIRDTADPASVSRQINLIRDDLRIYTWEDYAGIVKSMTNSFQVIQVILNAVNLLVAGITVFIVTYIDVTNRRRQIGIQRAIGITQSSIAISYLERAVFYAVTGSVLGILAFIYLVTPFEARYPFHFPFGDVYLLTGLSNITQTAFILIGAAVLAASVPVWLALRLKILDAIWG
jgi:putative ABC transport system permease protein